MNQNNKNKTIMYVVSYFPSTSQTFVLREITHLKSLGFQLKICALKSSSQEIKQHGTEAFMDAVNYIPDVASDKTKLFSLLTTNLLLGLKRPAKYLKAVIKALSSGNFKILLDLLKAGWAVQHLKLDKNIHLHAQFAHNPTNVAYFISLLNDNSISFTSHAVDIFVNPQLIKEKLERSKFAVTISKFNYNLLEKTYGKQSVENLHVIRCGIEKNLVNEQVNNSLNKPDQPISILTIGRMVEKKGFDILVDALKLLKDNGYNFTCNIVGDGGLNDELVKRVRDSHLLDHVNFLGALPSSDIQNEFKRADMFVLPCKEAENGDMDGIPVVLMEAIANYVPVVTTELSGIPELIIDQQTGLLAKPNDSISLYEKISSLIKHPEIKTDLTKKAAEHLKQEFLLESNVERLAELMKKQLVS
ncbi:glycosyltransferase family 4 protein [Bacillus sp. NEB1478]|uniref:glycosyltransferase family 4 protein n=1 Tax=Bacillus sp. NEB1478 TaxID=3073816 RepID=UPI002873AD3F|nr:glycosyltransferase family 4 protein [Bacillus sp. NEB1478]WNB92682.1 glycosyltransferase family 4 protein [Bacillus sp. NEB1478]